MARNIGILALLSVFFFAFAIAEVKVASKEYLNKQKLVWHLLWRPDQPDTVPELYTVGKEYSIKKNLANYKDEEPVQQFLKIYERGMLPRGAIFSPFYETQLEQAIALFRVFYHSKDFDTLYKTAAWAKIHVNEGLFVYTFSVAVYHHVETRGIRVLAFHEMYPNLFFSDEVIRKAYNERILLDPKNPSTQKIVIPANYSKYYEKYHWASEHKLSYYTEDVALNDIQAYSHIAHPFWLSAKEFPDTIQHSEDVSLFTYKLQLVRYNLERLANGMDEVEDFDWDYPIQYGYHPTTSYRNGWSLPHREAYAKIPSYNYKRIQELRNWERSLLISIDMGQYVSPNGTFVSFLTQNGLKTLGGFLEGHVDSANPYVYGAFERVARGVLGFSPEPLGPYKVFPSALQTYGVDQRDPMYWSLVKKIVRFYEHFTSRLPRYTHDDLAFPGVKIESVVVDRITTFFEPAEYLISTAVRASGPEDEIVIKARQYRLTHNPYYYHIDVTSELEVKANIRIFLGPRFNAHREEIDITESWRNFLLLDQWNVDLKVGHNKIERRCTDANGLVPDEESSDLSYIRLLKAIEGTETYQIPNKTHGYPERMVIPKGTKDGFPLQFFVFITPYAEGDRGNYQNISPLFRGKTSVDLPLGFPFDRPVSYNFTELRNGYSQNVKIYHVEKPEINPAV